jgi:hypothetical protein
MTGPRSADGWITNDGRWSAGSSNNFSSTSSTGAVMQRTFLFLASLVLAGAASSAGCRSCDSCHDYSPPVASCGCNSCGTQRSGSAGGGYATEGYMDGEGQPQQAIPQHVMQQ